MASADLTYAMSSDTDEKSKTKSLKESLNSQWDEMLHNRTNSTANVLGDSNALTPGKCLLCQKIQPKSAKNNDDGDNKFFWVCCECRQIDSTDLLLGNDLKLGNIYDILGENKGIKNRYKSDIDAQAAQLMWVELRHTVRCIYRKAGTELAIDHMLDVEKMKSLVHKLCERGPQQLYHQLETQGREYAEEVKFHLLEHLLCHPSSIGIPQHAREFAQTLLDEYEQLLCATITLQSFLLELEDEHMARFGITWMLVNQHLFHQVVYSDPIIQKSLPGVCIQLKYGELQQTPNTSSKFESYTSVYYRLKAFEEEMVRVEQQWIRAIVSLASFVNNEKNANKDEWEFLGRQHLMHQRETAIKNNYQDDSSDEKEDARTENIPASLLGHKKLFIKHTIPAPPIYPKPQNKTTTEVLKNVKVDQLSSGSIEIKAARVDEGSCVCDCAACTTLMDSLASNSPTDDESSAIEQNWVQIPDDLKDTGCDSSTQTIDETEDGRQSERRLSTSSVSSKDSDKPKYCACCYCELVGHPNPSSHNSHNYEIFREKLRKKLEYKRNPEKARRELCAEHQNNFNLKVEPGVPNLANKKELDNHLPKLANNIDNRSVEELVSFIEGPKEGKEGKRRKRKSKAKDSVKSESESKSETPVESDKTGENDENCALNSKNSAKKNKKNIDEVTIDLMTKECTYRIKMFNHKGVEMDNFAYHLDKYKNLSKEQKIQLLCGTRLQNFETDKQEELIKTVNMPQEMQDRSNPENMPNGKFVPPFLSLREIEKETGFNSIEVPDKTETEKARETEIVEVLKKEQQKKAEQKARAAAEEQAKKAAEAIIRKAEEEKKKAEAAKPKPQTKHGEANKALQKHLSNQHQKKPVPNHQEPLKQPEPLKQQAQKQVPQPQKQPQLQKQQSLQPPKQNAQPQKQPASPQKQPAQPRKQPEQPPAKQQKQAPKQQAVPKPTAQTKQQPKKEQAPKPVVEAQTKKNGERKVVVVEPAVKRPAEDKTPAVKDDNKLNPVSKKKFKKKKKRNESLDDIFLPKCEVDEMDYLDESERELEAFKRFCMDTQPLKTRQKIQLNWKSVNINPKKPI